ncbi:hypothetical protein [Longimicrobium sp.]|uniref:hypothetical protein n=1 Tax=Longimicrobium sp. TaxID=2029185 RepID=UPI003B3B33C3
MTTKPRARVALALVGAAAGAAPAAAQQTPPETRARQERERATSERQRTASDRMHNIRARAALSADAERRAFDMLLNHRTQLELNEQQVRQLESIRTRLEQQNAPLRARLTEEHQRVQAERRAQLERMSAEERRAELRRLRQQGRPAVPEALQPTVHQMRLNINEAVHQAQGVLTAEQRLRAQALLRAQVQRARRPGVRGQQPRRQPQGQMQRRRDERRERAEGRQP